MFLFGVVVRYMSRAASAARASRGRLQRRVSVDVSVNDRVITGMQLNLGHILGYVIEINTDLLQYEH